MSGEWDTPPVAFWAEAGDEAQWRGKSKGKGKGKAGNAEALREYWERGEGAAKIRWNTPGDWTRCHRNLKKYLGSEDAKGYCAKMHKRMTGRWPGSRANRDT